MAGYQVLVVLVAAAWAAAFLIPHRAHGLAWAAPPLGLVAGAALPLQVVLTAVMRVGRGA